MEDEPLSNPTEPEEVEDEIEDEISEPVNDDYEYEYDVFSPDFTYDEIYSPDFSGDEIVATEEEIQEEETKEEETNEDIKEDGEFGGYKLGNVYKGRKNIKDYENTKDIPLDLLVTKGDPTRL